MTIPEGLVAKVWDGNEAGLDGGLVPAVAITEGCDLLAHFGRSWGWEEGCLRKSWHLKHHHILDFVDEKDVGWVSADQEVGAEAVGSGKVEMALRIDGEDSAFAL